MPIGHEPDPPPGLTTPAAAAPLPPPRRRTAIVLSLSALLAAAAAVVGTARWWRPEPSAPAPPPDPRLTYTGPFGNIHPSVRYVGDAACADCHEKLCDAYHQHPMGRSFHRIAEVAQKQVYTKEAHNPFEALGVQFLVKRQDGRVWHEERRLDVAGQPLYRRPLEVHYAIGSGTRGYSYVTERDGYLFQTPVSWFSQKQIWDLSPGFISTIFTGRPITHSCIFCHANRFEPDEGYQHRFKTPIFKEQTAIGCERCHGPGEKHVASQGAFDIVNPRRLEPRLREAVCEQCHLEGEARVLRRGRKLFDYRPGLPLEEFLSVLVQPHGADEDSRAVNHVEQMHLSRCFQRTAGPDKLGCISCHDPHQEVGAARRVAHYRAACLKCHAEHGCSEPLARRRTKSKEDSCIDCHMPRYGASDIAHTASTDHRIVRHASQRPLEQAHDGNRGAIVLVNFHRGPIKPGDREGGRDLAVGLAQVALGGKVNPEQSVGQVLPLLEAAIRDFPDDFALRNARMVALFTQGRHEEASEDVEWILRRAPRWGPALRAAATTAENAGQLDKAIDCWRSLAEVRPSQPQYYGNVGVLLMRKGAWGQLKEPAELWMRADPSSAEARTLWATYLLRQGKRAEAQAEFRTVEALRPPNLAVLRARFETELRIQQDALGADEFSP